MDKSFTSYFRHLRQFGHLTEDDTMIIAAHCTLDLVPVGEFYLQEGKVCNQLGFISQGVMRYCNVGVEGNLQTCYFISENDLAGDPESFARRNPSKLILQAITDCLLIQIDRSHHESLLKVLPEFGNMSALMVQVFMTSLTNQRAFLLNNDAKGKYEYFVNHYPHILSRVPLGMVASYLGIKQQSLSRLRAQK